MHQKECNKKLVDNMYYSIIKTRPNRENRLRWIQHVSKIAEIGTIKLSKDMYVEDLEGNSGR